jgi:hypothetical protein
MIDVMGYHETKFSINGKILTMNTVNILISKHYKDYKDA